jgi:hypothetical protein
MKGIGRRLAQFRELEDSLLLATVKGTLTDELIDEARLQIFPILQEIKQNRPDLPWIDGHLRLYESNLLLEYLKLNREKIKTELDKRKRQPIPSKSSQRDTSQSIWAFGGGLPSLGKRS